jgi:hypothetical protein
LPTAAPPPQCELKQLEASILSEFQTLRTTQEAQSISLHQDLHDHQAKIGHGLQLLRGSQKERNDQVTALCKDVKDLQASQKQQNDQVTALFQGVTTLRKDVKDLQASQDTLRVQVANSSIRESNASSRKRDVNLQPLQCGTAGAHFGKIPQEGLHFPLMRRDILKLTKAELGALITFYGESFSGNHINVRRSRFSAFIGVGADYKCDDKN